jgi:hypothetical protein
MFKQEVFHKYHFLQQNKYPQFSHTVHFRISYSPVNKQWLLPQTALTDWTV